jgi:uncharacterized protein (TIGR00661 family)
MTLSKNPSIFYAVLNMGLGHASRSLPIIRALLQKNFYITIGSSGRSLTFLEQELPTANFVELPDYQFDYSRKGVTIGGILKRLPNFFSSVVQEKAHVQQLVKNQNFNLIISDNRYGCHAPEIPSLFLSHQLRFIAPPGLRAFEFLGFWFNRYFHKNFTSILIPDESNEREGVISGRMSRITSASHYQFCGILSSLSRKNLEEDIDVLFSISGPEPQRTIFEQIIRDKLPRIPGKKVIALGKPESDEIEKPNPDLLIYNHPSRIEMEKLYNRSKIVVCRSGYSTIMELVELRKKALFVPTPGQTEQLYLAKRLQSLGGYHWISQNDTNFEEHLRYAVESKKTDFKLSTKLTLSRILQILNDYDQS